MYCNVTTRSTVIGIHGYWYARELSGRLPSVKVVEVGSDEGGDGAVASRTWRSWVLVENMGYSHVVLYQYPRAPKS